MAGRKSDFTLPTLDDLFSTQELRDDAKLSKIRDIPLELIDDFPDHPFKVRDDEDMIQLVESVKERGVITPATVRQKEDGRYELISGHRRKRACELAGFEALRCEVVDLDRDAATVLMVESNYQRSQILPSEKAFAYKMRLEAMKRQAGRPSKENSVPVAQNYEGKTSRELLGEQVGESQDQVRRYIRLTNLVPELLDLVDEGKIKMRPAVELSYLDEDSQRAVVDANLDYSGTWGHSNLHYMNGWYSGESKYTTIRAMHSYDGNICYCIEPGTPQDTGDRYTSKDETFWDNLPSDFNSTISPYDMKLFIGRIMPVHTEKEQQWGETTQRQ